METNNLAVVDLRLHEKDVGSPQVQISRLTSRILHISGHLKTHPKDNHTRRGLIAMVSLRRKLLAYIKRKNPASYAQTLAALGLRK